MSRDQSKTSSRQKDTKKETSSRDSSETEERKLILKVSLPTMANPYEVNVTDPNLTFFELMDREARNSDDAIEINAAMKEDDTPIYDPFVGDREVTSDTRLRSLETADKEGNDVIDVKLRVRRR